MLRPMIAVVLCALFPGVGLYGEAAHEKPDVLLVTVDTLRPDALGWVAGKNVTPHLDALAEGAYRFADAVSPAPVTLPSHAALMTGQTPRRLGTRDNGQVLAEGIPTLAELFSGAGYRTAAFVSGFPLDASFGLNRGFDHYDDDFSAGGGDRRQLERPAAQTTDAVVKWLQQTGDAPWFLWVHYYDPHDPYEAPVPADLQGGDLSKSIAAYYAEVRVVDDAVGRLREAVRGSKNLLTILAADHGESLGEHGEQTHGFFIYNSTQSVPLLFHWPSQITPRQDTTPVGLVDVAPTVAELLELQGLPSVDGRSLAANLRRKTAPTSDGPPIYLESRRPWSSYGWAPLRGIRWGHWKLIAAPKPELYNLSTDPGESDNLVDQNRRQARRLADRLRELEQAPAASKTLAADDEAQAKLLSLGYAGTGEDPGEPPRGLPDPKDRIEPWNALSKALEALESGDLDESLRQFDRVLKVEPDNPFALSRSAKVLIRQKRWAQAAERLQRAVELRPRDADSWGLLAQAYLSAGRLDPAVESARRLSALQPGRLEGWMIQAVGHGRSGRQQEATDTLAQAVRVAPERTDLLLRLAFAQHSLGRPAEAAASLQAAAERMGAAFPHAGALGLMYSAAGDLKNAEIWLARAGSREPEMPQARLELARLLAERGEIEAARRALEEALAAQPALRAQAAQIYALKDLLP